MFILAASVLVGAVLTYVMIHQSAMSAVESNADNGPQIDTDVSVPMAQDDSGNPVSLINPQDKSTWPHGDKIWNLCRAVAVAEGYGPPNNVPTLANNPGDLGLGDIGYGEIIV